MTRLALAGPMGVGKTTVGRALAARLGVPFVDLDAGIGDIPAIFATEGESGFRAREARALAEAVDGEGVLALGGGTVVNPHTRALLHGWRVVVLDAPLPTLLARIGDGAGRPLAGDLGRRLAERAEAYAASGPRIDADRPVDAVVDELVGFAGSAPLRHGLSLSLGYRVLLEEGFDALPEALGAARRAVLVTNDRVGPLYATAVERVLARAGWTLEPIVIPDGEAHKTLTTWQAVVEGILDLGVDRRTPVLALGGGVVGDLAGFAAAATLRGLPVVQLPTTLLAMVDSSVGGKTGVNTRHGKNLVGAFHQPSLVYAAFSTVRTLPDAELRCGLGEVVKHAVLAGPAALAELEADADALARRDAAALVRGVAMSVRLKAAVVEADPTEKGLRATLNLGHTLGHAVEAVAGYGVVPHGEAVAVGMLAALRYAEQTGVTTDPTLRPRVEALLDRLGLGRRLPPLDPDALAAAAAFDKKRDRGMVTLVLPAAPGDVRLVPVPPAELRRLAGCLRQT